MCNRYLNVVPVYLSLGWLYAESWSNLTLMNLYSTATLMWNVSHITDKPLCVLFCFIGSGSVPVLPPNTSRVRRRFAELVSVQSAAHRVYIAKLRTCLCVPEFTRINWFIPGQNRELGLQFQSRAARRHGKNDMWYSFSNWWLSLGTENNDPN